MCDVDADGNGNDDWVNKWFEPSDPREEGMEADAGEERQSESRNQGGAEEHHDEDDEAAGGQKEDEHDEAQKPKGVKAPNKPSKDEVDEHMITHLPFRSWCPHCGRGKSKGKPQKIGTRPKINPHVGIGLHVHV